MELSTHNHGYLSPWHTGHSNIVNSGVGSRQVYVLEVHHLLKPLDRVGLDVVLVKLGVDSVDVHNLGQFEAGVAIRQLHH